MTNSVVNIENQDVNSDPTKRRQKLLEILRKNESWMQTKSIWVSLPEEVRTWDFPCPNPRDHDTAVVCVHGRQVFAHRVGEATVYQDLKLLEREDLVRSKKEPIRQSGGTMSRPMLQWRAVRPGEQVDAAIASIVYGQLME